LSETRSELVVDSVIAEATVVEVAPSDELVGSPILSTELSLEQVDEDVELPDEAVLETESTVELRLVKALLMEVACWVV